MRSILRMWEFWLNYVLILLVVLPFPAINMTYVVTMDGQEIAQEAKSRAVWECYKFAMLEGLGNPWNLMVVALHWLIPFVFMALVWSLLLRKKAGAKQDSIESNSTPGEVTVVNNHD